LGVPVVTSICLPRLHSCLQGRLYSAPGVILLDDLLDPSKLLMLSCDAFVQTIVKTMQITAISEEGGVILVAGY
jgi:hypothetical protein